MGRSDVVGCLVNFAGGGHCPLRHGPVHEPTKPGGIFCSVRGCKDSGSEIRAGRMLPAGRFLDPSTDAMFHPVILCAVALVEKGESRHFHSLRSPSAWLLS